MADAHGVTYEWSKGDAYDAYVGRWSRIVAKEFLSWLDVAPGAQWLDVGCGSGTLVRGILETQAPRSVRGIDSSAGFVDYARSQVRDGRAEFDVGDAQALPYEDATYDAVVSGLVLNFVEDPKMGLAQMARVTRPGGTVAIYVWDYAGEMQLMSYFWHAATALDSNVRYLDEGLRFALCKPEPLESLFGAAGLDNVTTRAIDIATEFRDFNDYWMPFLGGQGSAPTYTMSLDEERRAELREHLRSALPIAADGSIHLVARAWAVRGTR